MAVNWLDVSYAGENKKVLIISARGYIDMTTAPDITKLINESIALRKYKIIVNLEGVDYISSTGWGVFVAELKDIRQNNGDLVLTNMCPNVLNIFELMEFSSILKAFKTVEEAGVYFAGLNETPGVQRAVPTRAGMMTGSKIPRPSISSKPSLSPAVADTPGEHALEYSIDAYRNEIFNIAHYELGKNIIKIISEKPYFSITEITRALRQPKYGGRKQKKNEVKKELKEMGLLKRRARFEFVLKGRVVTDDFG